MARRKMGEPFETAYCRHCRQAIHRVWWGTGGTLWEHIETELVECYVISHASPTPSTIQPIREESA